MWALPQQSPSPLRVHVLQALSARASTVARHVARNVQGVRRMSMVPQDEAIRAYRREVVLRG